MTLLDAAGVRPAGPPGIKLTRPLAVLPLCSPGDPARTSAVPSPVTSATASVDPNRSPASASPVPGSEFWVIESDFDGCSPVGDPGTAVISPALAMTATPSPGAPM